MEIRGKLSYADSNRLITGRIEIKSQGFAFVTPIPNDAHKTSGDIFIKSGCTKDAFNGDTVLVKLRSHGHPLGKGPSGELVRVTKRGRTSFVCRMKRSPGNARPIAQAEGITPPLTIRLAEAERITPRVGDMVLVEITHWPEEGSVQKVRGRPVKIISAGDDPVDDTQVIIHLYQLPEAYPPSVVKESSSQKKITKKEQVGRRDLKDLCTITVDPVTAKDYDDAISLERMNGIVRLGVHIADVSHFVRPGSALDKEARRRGTTVYFPDRTLHMLPEQLSENFCSLKEGVPRLTKSVFMDFSEDGELTSFSIERSVITSDKRLSYEDVQAVIDGNRSSCKSVGGEINRLLNDAHQLALKLNAKRLERGALELELPEMEIYLERSGAMDCLIPVERSWSHRIIEEFMLQANECVAKYLIKHNLPGLFRTHDEPDRKKLVDLAHFARSLKLSIKTIRSRKNIANLLEASLDKPYARALHYIVLRCLARAEYHPRQGPHYALAIEDYSHFTSPIRRYPDLFVHQILQDHLAGQFTRRAGEAFEKGLDELAGSLNDLSRRAESAERELEKVKILKYLAKCQKRSFNGLVTTVGEFGIIVELEDFIIDGLVPMAKLKRDWYELDRRSRKLVGTRKGHTYGVGDRLKVHILEIDISQRKLLLTPDKQEKVS